jgi:hypothetical protein
MKIELTEEQFKTLLKLAYMARWIATYRNAEDVEEYVSLEEYLFSLADECGLEKFAEYNEEIDGYIPSREFEEETNIRGIMNEYEDSIFWDQLISRLVYRDLIRTIGEENIKNADREEVMKMQENFVKSYLQEFSRNGIENLEIVKK